MIEWGVLALQTRAEHIMNLKTKTTKEILQLMESIEISPALQIISLNTYKGILEELRDNRKLRDIEDMDLRQDIVDKAYYFRIYKDGNIEDCLKWIKSVQETCRMMCE